MPNVGFLQFLIKTRLSVFGPEAVDPRRRN
jgi:hypothetical protein